MCIFDLSGQSNAVKPQRPEPQARGAMAYPNCNVYELNVLSETEVPQRLEACSRALGRRLAVRPCGACGPSVRRLWRAPALQCRGLLCFTCYVLPRPETRIVICFLIVQSDVYVHLWICCSYSLLCSIFVWMSSSSMIPDQR